MGVRLETGRMHQIRSHLSSEGFPLLGDAHYGDGSRRVGIFLHAYRLGLRLPDGAALDVTCPLPQSLRLALASLGAVDRRSLAMRTQWLAYQRPAVLPMQ